MTTSWLFLAVFGPLMLASLLWRPLIVAQLADAGGVDLHHLIDPTTGSAAQTDVATVTVVAADAWWAEALATALSVSPAPAVLGTRHDASVLVVSADGTRTATPELQGALR